MHGVYIQRNCFFLHEKSALYSEVILGKNLAMSW